MKIPTCFKVAYTEEDPNSSGMPSIKKNVKLYTVIPANLKYPKSESTSLVEKFLHEQTTHSSSSKTLIFDNAFSSAH